MALSISAASTTALISLLLLVGCCTAASGGGIDESDVELLEFPLNLEYLEADFFSYGAFGSGLDKFEPNLTKGGPPPVGAKKAKLTPLIRDIVAQFAFQEFGHLRAIQQKVSGFPRPLLNLSAESFATVMNDAVGEVLEPSFDPYASDVNYLLASYVIPYVGLTGYVGASAKLKGPVSKKLVAGLLGVESGQDAVIRTLLYERARMKVYPYRYTVAEFTDKISSLRDKLGKGGKKDEGLIVKPAIGAEGKIAGNVLAGDKNSLAYDRTPEEILRIVYSSGDESHPGGFYPEGGRGKIAEHYLNAQGKTV